VLQLGLRRTVWVADAATISWGRRKPLLERVERPLFRAFGLSRTYASQKPLGRKAVRADAFFKLPGGTVSPRRTGRPQQRAQRSLLIPLSERGEHSHPPSIDGKNRIRGVAGWEA